MSTALPASTNAGKAAHGVAAADALDGARQLVEIVGPAAQPGSFQLAGDRLGDGLPDRRGELCPAAPRDPCRAPPRCRPPTPRRTSPAGAEAACRGRTRRSARARRSAGAVRAATACSSGSPSRVESGKHRAGGVGRGNEVAAQVLWQRPDQRGDQFLPQRGHLPGELVAAEAGQHLDRHVHRDAVVVGARLEPVGQRQRQVVRPARCPAGRRRTSSVRSRSSRVKVSRSGVWCRCFFHHASKCRAETTSAGMRAS